MPVNNGLTVVLGGGGIWGIAWMTGVVAGLADAGIGIGGATSFIGTSAGAVMSAQLASGLDATALFERQVSPAGQSSELSPDPAAVAALTSLLQSPWPTDRARLDAICAHARTVKTGSQADRRASIAERLGALPQAWPKKQVRITAVDIDSLELQAFTAESGVSMVDAITASCAVPGIWPPTQIKGRFYIDGGVWKTGENAHLAAGSSSVFILAPLGRIEGLEGESALARDITELRANGSKAPLSLPTRPRCWPWAATPWIRRHASRVRRRAGGRARRRPTN